eukprot:5907479-Amphidinium_carterae.1
MTAAADRIVQHLQRLDDTRCGRISQRKIEAVLQRLDPDGNWSSRKVSTLLQAAGLANSRAATDTFAYEKL